MPNDKLQQLFVTENYERLKGYLEIQPPDEPTPEVLDRGRTPTVLRMERSRRIDLPWKELLPDTAGRQGLEIAAYREWFERSWRVRPKDHAAALAGFIFKATAEMPVYGPPSGPLGGYETFTNGWVMRMARPEIYYLVVAEGAADDLDFLSGLESYERSWQRVSKLVFVLHEPPRTGTLPFPLETGGIGRPVPGPDPLPPWVQPLPGSRRPPGPIGGGIGPLGLVETSGGARAGAAELDLSRVVISGRWQVSEQTEPQDVARMRSVLEASWGFDPARPAPYADYVKVLDATNAGSYHRPTEIGLEYTTVQVTGDSGKKETQPATQEVWGFEPLEAGDVLLRHGTSGLWYLVRPQEGTGALMLQGSQAAYETAWQSQIESIELVVEHSGAGAPPRETWPFQEESEIDLAPQVIVAEYRRLELRREAAQTVAGKAKLWLDELVKGDHTVDEVLEASQRYVELEEQVSRFADSIRTLEERSHLLGYVLVTDSEKGTVRPFAKFPFQGSSPETAKLRAISFELEEGALYRTRQVRRYWTETVTRTRWESYTSVSWGLFGPRLRRRRRRVTTVRHVHQNHAYLEWTQVPLDLDPLLGERVLLEGQGFEASVFELTPDGWRDENGGSLEELMKRCEVEEDLRRHMAVILPVYEQSLVEGLVKTRWRIIRRPLPGVVPLGLPELFFQESLSYRNRWAGTELGELLQSINLAPGERRQVSVSRTITQRREETREITSLLDVTTSSSDELATEIEKEARSERERTQTSSWNASASASYFGFVSASGGASGSSSSTAKDFARSFQRIARKAASSITQNTRQEVKTTSRSESSVSVSETTSGEIQNVNAGRTLNLLFYQLRNVYLGGVFLDELGFTMLRSRELIAGTGIRDAVTSARRDLQGFLDAVADEWRVLTLFGVDPMALLIALVGAVEQGLLDEYLDSVTRSRLVGSSPERPGGEDRTAGAFEIPGDLLEAYLAWQLGQAPPAAAPPVEGAPVDEEPSETLARRVREVSELILVLRQTDVPVSGVERLALPSRAVYLDAKIGFQPGAEPYSERMREAEYLARLRDSELVHARALAEAGRAAALASQAAGGADAPDLATPQIEQVRVDETRKRLILDLTAPLPEGMWLLQVGGRPAIPVSAGEGETAIVLEWSGARPWWAVEASADAPVSLLDVLRRVRVVPRWDS